ncbi:MAG: DEAD/DEAH box helicase [Verrucomicrobiota bacterium]
MSERDKVMRAADRFLRLVPAQTRARGRSYHANGQVVEVTCVKPDEAYTAIVRGGEDYAVTLNYADRNWAADCSCPMHYDCKHTVAAMLEVQKRWAEESPAKPIPTLPPANKPAKQKPPRDLRPLVPQPPASPLYERLVDQLGRPLDFPEAGFIRKIQTLYTNAGYRQLTENDLSQLFPRHFGYGWVEVDLWPKKPKDDYELWLYLAVELRRRKIPLPGYMEAITDFTTLEAGIKKWQRQKEVAQWQDWFASHEPNVAPTADTLDLRLAFLDEEARLQWRTQPDGPFADLKQAQAKRFGENVERGTLTIAPDALPLWSALYKPWSYESWWSIRYNSEASRLPLNRLIRLALPPERFVNGHGEPLARPAEPLRLQLNPPAKNGEDYELRLTTAEGQEPPPIRFVLSGHPTLYITDTAIYAGPPKNALEHDSRKVIPAPALETAGGIRFLHALNLPLPEHLAERTKIIPVAVTLTCELKETYPGSTSEQIILRPTAQADGLEKEDFTPHGWQTPSQGWGRIKTAKPVKGFIPVHDRSAQAHFPRVLDALGVKWASYGGGWTLRLTKKTPELFVAWLQNLPPEITVELDRELATLRDAPISGTVTLDVQEAGIDWFDLKVILNVADLALTPEETKLLLNARGGYVRLGTKGWRRLQFNLTPEDDEQLARLGLAPRDFTAEPQRFHALQLADEAAKKFLAPARVEQIHRRVGELKTRVAPPLPDLIHAELRPYQVEGFHFLAYLTTNRFGGVLADDMGLGKTLQALAWIAWLRNAALNPQTCTLHPSLVVCPKSVTDNWVSESARFYPSLRVRRWSGETADALTTARAEADIIVVNYAQLRSLSPAIAKVVWQAVILDEAQYIKNPDSQTAQAARALKADYRLGLTGTPIENRLLDLWSIFSFAMPGVLGNRTEFLRRFNAQDDPLARRRLAARVRPFLLRRTKGQVAKDLPDRVEEDLFCDMEGEQLKLYQAEFKRAQILLLGVQTSAQLNEQRFNVLTSLLRLRQICCHPALVNEKLHAVESAKVNALLDLLEPLMEEGHKVLVFSQFVTMLDLLRETVKQREWPHYYLAGSTENRGDLVKEFQSAKGGAVFLISLKAGGFGLNLTAASYVVLFDPWWNPAVENQAIDRTHRIGQTSKVMAYRLLMRESIEEKIRALQKQKGALMTDVLGEEKFAQSLTLDDLRFLLAD